MPLGMHARLASAGFDFGVASAGFDFEVNFVLRNGSHGLVLFLFVDILVPTSAPVSTSRFAFYSVLIASELSTNENCGVLQAFVCHW